MNTLKKIIAIILSAFIISLLLIYKFPHPRSHNKEMENFIKKTMRKNHVRGNILIIKNGKSQIIRYGYANYNKHILNSNKNVAYPIGSLQKVVTATMLIQIMHEKKDTKQAFSQNTKISRWYPTLKNANKISVGNLLTHTSGITLKDTEKPRHYNYSESEAINWIINKINMTPQDKAGKKFSYNNANYVLLAGIISKLTNCSYQTNLNERIVQPLNLHNTFLASDTSLKEYKAISYKWNKRLNYQDSLYLTNDTASQLPGAGNLYTTPTDYFKIQQSLYNGKLLTKKQFNYMTHLKSRITNYSGGMYIKNNDKLKLAYGSNQHTHFCNWIQTTVDNKNGIIMFLNQSQGNKNAEKKVGYTILQKIKTDTFSNR